MPVKPYADSFTSIKSALTTMMTNNMALHRTLIAITASSSVKPHKPIIPSQRPTTKPTKKPTVVVTKLRLTPQPTNLGSLIAAVGNAIALKGDTELNYPCALSNNGTVLAIFNPPYVSVYWLNHNTQQWVLMGTFSKGVHPWNALNGTLALSGNGTQLA